MKFKRVFLIVCDSMGIGHAKDASVYHDENANTIGHICKEKGGLAVPNMEKLGLGNLGDFKGIKKVDNPLGYGFLGDRVLLSKINASYPHNLFYELVLQYGWIVGGLIGGMVGYALSSATYGVLLQSLKEEKLAHEQRTQIEKICDDHIKMIREYRAEMESIINKYLIDSMDIFRESFTGIKDALAIGDVDWFIESTNTITESFGVKTSFSNMEEFNTKMIAGGTFRL